MDRLAISCAIFIGYNMDEKVRLSGAVQSLQRGSKVVVVGSPITGFSLAVQMKLLGLTSIAEILFIMM